MLTVGQKVRVKSSLVVGRNYGGVAFVPEMADYRGRTFTISLARDMGGFEFYRLEGISFSYSEEMLTTIESEADALTIKVGDTVKIIRVLGRDRDLGIKEGDLYTVKQVDSDGDVYIKAPVGESRFMTPSQYVKAPTKAVFTFSEIVKMIADKELEDGQELINGGNTYTVKDYCGEHTLRELSAVPKLYTGMINEPWTLVVPESEPEIEMTVAEIQEKLGHKVKIVDQTN